MSSKQHNGHGNDTTSGSSTQTLSNGDRNGTANGSTANGHGSKQRQPLGLVAVPEMCSFCFDVLDGELGGKGVQRQPCFIDDAL